MSATPSTMLEIGTKAPAFSLSDVVSGEEVSVDDFNDKNALLVVFICNHCPYVLHIIDRFAEVAKEYRGKGIGIVAISSNDIEKYPDDSPQKMKSFAKEHSFTFPYLYDETQETAKAYRAACTPDFFLFDHNRELVYRGQFDGSRPGNEKPVTGEDLRAAMDALLEDRSVPEEQTPSVGCNIKWKPGNEPAYFG